MLDARFETMLDAMLEPMLLLSEDARVTLVNRSARAMLPFVRPGLFPLARRDARFRTFLSRCLGSPQPVPGVLELDDGDEPRSLRCWGSRLDAEAGDAPSVLLRVVSPDEHRFRTLTCAVERLERELSLNSRLSQRLGELLIEREHMIAQLESEASRRAEMKRERDEILVRLYSIHQRDRLRLARDLHDHAGQHIVCLKLGLGQIKARLADVEARSAVEGLMRQVDRAGEDLHRVAVELRPAALEEFGLATALRTLLDDWSAASGVAADFRTLGDARSVAAEAEVTLFRLVQEGLTNVAKHAGEVARVALVLVYTPTHIALTLEDDGAGFDAAGALRARKDQSFGLLGMAERLALVRGSIEIDSKPGCGTSIFARIPFDTGSPHA